MLDKYTQNILASSGEFNEEENYWQEKLQGEIVLSSFPADLHYENEGLYQRGIVSFDLPDKVYQKVLSISKGSEYAMFMVMLSGVKYLMSRYSGSEDIIIGMPAAKNETNEVYVNDVIVLRTLIDKNDSLKSLLLKVRQTITEAVKHQDLPYARLLELIKNGCDNSSCELFQTAVVMQNIGEMTFLDDKKLDIIFSFLHNGNSIQINIHYNINIYSDKMVKQISNHFTALMDYATNQPDALLSEFDMLSSSEKNKILFDFNATETDYPKDKTIHRIFEDMVMKYPDNIAVVYNNKTFTYSEINRKANRLARKLRKMGVKENNIVGILIERSPEMIVGILGILKAGGAYLPIDPKYPVQRILTLLNDSNADLLVTNTEVSKNDYSDSKFKQNLVLMDQLDLDHSEDADNLEDTSKPCDLAYVMYTSGSTGTPKGTLITHNNISRVVKKTNYIEILPEDIILQLSNYSFDGSVFDIYGALLNGAKLVMMDQDIVYDIIKLRDVITKQGITVLFLTTALFNTIVDISIESLSDIRKILFGGERVSLRHVRKAYEYMGSGKMLHVYGPTESTVFSTCYEINEVDESLNTIPIGKPISNTKVYILNRNNRPVPLGVKGEICISGAGIAKGYLNQLELTAEKFVPNPFVNGEVMYKTGDLAKWDMNGNIEFIGRADNQIKLRGFRIELGEIEVVLAGYKKVKEAIVGVKEDKKGNRFLCAYIVQEEEIDIENLRKYMADKLPEYMIPTVVKFVDSMPLNQNGKVDKKALMKIEAGDFNRLNIEAPENEVEEKLVCILEEILGIKDLGVNDNLFERGANSLNTITYISKVYDEFGVEIPVDFIFKNSNVRDNAQFVLNVDKMKDYLTNCMLLNKDNKGEKTIFCFPPAISVGTVYQSIADILNSYAFYSFNFIECAEVYKAFADEIIKIKPQGPYILLGYSSGGNFAFEVAKELIDRGCEVSDIIFLDSYYKGTASTSLTDKELDNYADELVKAFVSKQEGLKHSEDAFKNLFSKKIVSYYKVYANMVNSGIINSKIHLIKAVNDKNSFMEGISENTKKIKEQATQNDWSASTTVGMSVYQGVGDHHHMLDGECLERNTEVIRSILENS